MPGRPNSPSSSYTIIKARDMSAGAPSQEQGIPLFNSPADTGFRLVELPPELQSLLESDQAPVLTLDSSETSAILKTPGQSYALRQKNTSNSVMLLAPHSSPSNPAQGLAIISTIHETVELDKLPEKPVGSTPGLKNTGSRGKWHERFGRNR